jgi:hypothetical protein
MVLTRLSKPGPTHSHFYLESTLCLPPHGIKCVSVLAYEAVHCSTAACSGISIALCLFVNGRMFAWLPVDTTIDMLQHTRVTTRYYM